MTFLEHIGKLAIEALTELGEDRLRYDHVDCNGLLVNDSGDSVGAMPPTDLTVEVVFVHRDDNAQQESVTVKWGSETDQEVKDSIKRQLQRMAFVGLAAK